MTPENFFLNLTQKNIGSITKKGLEMNLQATTKMYSNLCSTLFDLEIIYHMQRHPLSYKLHLYYYYYYQFYFYAVFSNNFPCLLFADINIVSNESGKIIMSIITSNEMSHISPHLFSTFHYADPTPPAKNIYDEAVTIRKCFCELQN